MQRAIEKDHEYHIACDAAGLLRRNEPEGWARPSPTVSTPESRELLMKLEEESLLRVGVSGSYGGMNLGDEAVLQTIIVELRGRLTVEIVVFCMDPEHTAGCHDVDRAVPVRR